MPAASMAPNNTLAETPHVRSSLELLFPLRGFPRVVHVHMGGVGRIAPAHAAVFRHLAPSPRRRGAPSRRPCVATSSARCAGTTMTPSSSPTTKSPGITTTPPQPIISCTPAGIRPTGLGGAAAPAQKIGRPMSRISRTSRMPPSGTIAATPRAIRPGHQHVAEPADIAVLLHVHHQDAARRDLLDRLEHDAVRVAQVGRDIQVLALRHVADRVGRTSEAAVGRIERRHIHDGARAHAVLLVELPGDRRGRHGAEPFRQITAVGHEYPRVSGSISRRSRRGHGRAGSPCSSRSRGPGRVGSLQPAAAVVERRRR